MASTRNQSDSPETISQLTPRSTSSQPDEKHRLDMMSQWTLETSKNGGANGAGQYGGIYVDDKDNPTRRVLFKQDHIAKNICEVVAGGLMRQLSDDPSAFAEVAFSLQPGMDMKSFHPERETGEHVYVASVFFDTYKDLYVDAYLASSAYPEIYNPQGERSKQKIPTAQIPPDRPKLHNEDVTIKRVIRMNRYAGLPKVLAWSLFFDDPDVHTMNIGAVKHVSSDSRAVMMQQKGKDVKKVDVYQSVKAVRIDYAGALGSKKIIHRQLDGKLHPDDLSPMLAGPPNYFAWYPSDITRSAAFADELLYLSKIPQSTLVNAIHHHVGEAAKFYNSTALLEFAKLIGVKNLDDSEDNKAKIVTEIKEFMKINFLARQWHAKELAAEIRQEIADGGRYFDCIKRSIKRVYNPRNLLRSDRDAFLAAPTPGNVYNQFESIFRPVTIIKNGLKVVTELLPSAIEELAAFQASKIVKRSVASKHKQLSALDQGLIFILFLLRMTGKLLLAVGSRITSPIRAANETFELIYNASFLLDNHAQGVAKTLAWFGYGLSLVFSALAMGAVAVVASTAMAAALGSSALITGAVHAIPYLGALGSAMTSAVAPVAAALHVAIVKPALAAAYAGFTVLASLTLIPLRILVKSLFKKHNEYYDVVQHVVNDVPASQERRSSSSLSSTAQYSRSMSISLSDSIIPISTSPSEVGRELAAPDGSPKATVVLQDDPALFMGLTGSR